MMEVDKDGRPYRDEGDITRDIHCLQRLINDAEVILRLMDGGDCGLLEFMFQLERDLGITREETDGLLSPYDGRYQPYTVIPPFKREGNRGMQFYR
tara:strand:+ start:193 stop:480 length:288 start_codon:yes stop_codon:yes gene_type:complete